MRYHREFEIGWFGMALGLHTFEYEINDRIISEMGYEKDDSYDALNAIVRLKFDKKSSFFVLNFDIDGTVTLPCDRCGTTFDLKLWDEFQLIIKLTGEQQNDTHSEDSDEGDIVFIPRSETVINVFEWVYEFVMLSIPIQHVHPNDAKGNSNCDPKALALLNSLLVTDVNTTQEEQDEAEREAQRNKIWKGLDKFKF